jgi:hypothetical protein
VFHPGRAEIRHALLFIRIREKSSGAGRSELRDGLFRNAAKLTAAESLKSIGPVSPPPESWRGYLVNNYR